MIIKLLKIGAILEGLSVMALFLVAMPMKYIWNDPSLIKSTGMVHGLLFVAYFLLVLVAAQDQKWKFGKTLFSLFLGFVPFGTFYAERKLF